MIAGTQDRQGKQSENATVDTFLARLRNFFRHPLAAADVPPGARWSDRDAFDPWCDPFWRA